MTPTSYSPRERPALNEVRDRLRESEERYKSLVEQLPAITYTVDLGEINRTVFISPQVESILGFTREEWLADHELWKRLIHPADRESIVSEVLAKNITGEPFALTYRSFAKDGRIVWFRNHAAYIPGEDGRPRTVHGVMLDITAYMEAEEALQQHEVILDALRYAAQEYLQSTSWETVTDEVLARLGRAMNVSRIYVFQNDEHVGDDTISSQRYEWVAEGISAEIDNPILQRMSFKSIGLGRWVGLAQNRSYIAGLTKDFPEEEQVILRDQQIQAILVAPIYVGNLWWGFLGVDECTRPRIWYEMESAALRTAADTLGSAIARQRADEALRLNREQLRQSQKMDALGRLAGGIAHDFNNLLTSILGYSRLIRETLPDGHPTIEDIEEVIRAGERAAKLTQQLLAFGRKQIVEVRPIRLNEAIRDMIKILERTLGEDIQLVLKLDESGDLIDADPGQIDQIIMNLAVNARDAMPHGGKLEIRTHQTRSLPSPSSARTSMDRIPFVCMTFRDSGVGMNAEVLEHAFEPFFTTKEKGKGIGLGLSTVYGIVQQNGGFIELDSLPGKGTTFRLYFPASSSETATGAIAPVPEEAPHGKEVILVVEDEANVRKLTARILSSLGYRVIEAANGLEALKLIRDERPVIDLILSDVVMPHMSGPELIRRLRAGKHDFKTIYMTGFTQEAIVHRGDRELTDPLILKPYTREGLAAKIRQVLDG